ncbi:PDC sensor domain-containing protein [Pseudoalteromonas phenolica]|uniref:PDC sensor domain-containing protein n=1 Tax=Pseudoalteromonas phenolica TaxID=161398 RepID=UPI002015EF18|nr:cache domain-containing protein [Pseudoalteromonas phenolica]
MRVKDPWDNQLTKPLLTLFLFISVCGFIINSFYQIQQTRSFSEDVRAQVKAQTLNAAAEVGEELEKIMTSVDRFAREVTATPDKTFVLKLLEDEFAVNEDIYSLNVTFHPYQYQHNVRYFSPYFERLTGIERKYNLVDYDKPYKEFSWYHRPLKEGPIWTEPYYEPQNNVLMTTYSVPFYQYKNAKLEGKLPLGVVPSDISLDHLTASLKELDLGLGGYGILFSEQQNLISHPVFSHVREMENLGDLVSETEFAYLSKIAGCFEKDLDYLFFNGETLDNSEHYAACTKVPHTNWTLITRMSSDMFYMDRDERRQNNIHIIAWGAASFIFLILLMTKIRKLTWTQNNILLSVTLILSTSLVLEFARSFKTLEQTDNVVITTQAQREAFSSSYSDRMETMHVATPEYVATGLYVESLEFVNANNVHLTGHAWQKLSASQKTSVEPKLAFNHTVNSKIEEAYRQNLKDGGLLVGWRFSIETRQQFDYSKYPFDHKSIELSFNEADMGGNVILVPDLESYEKLSKMDNPAVSPDIVLDEWLLKSSYFKYRFESYNTDFGLDTFFNQNVAPELNYNINIEREFIGPFVTTLLPVMVMVCLLYACVVSMKYTPYGDLRNNITAVVFTILLAHYSIREHLQIDEVVYFEIFYFLLYLVSSLFMLIAHQYYKAKEETGDGRIYKRLANIWFWPVMTISIFIITILTYY